MDPLLRKLGIELPIIQAPMAGVSTPEMAAAVSNAGGVGSVGVGSVDAETTRKMIAAVRSRTDRPFNVNVFCNRPAAADAVREAAWLARLGPDFARYGAKPPARLTEIYQSFLTDDAKLAVLLAERPAVVSFHFGLPERARIELSAGPVRIAGLRLALREELLGIGIEVRAGLPSPTRRLRLHRRLGLRRLFTRRALRDGRRWRRPPRTRSLRLHLRRATRARGL